MALQKRFAGARLGSTPIEDVTDQIKQTLEKLEVAKGVQGFNRTVKVPGTEETVHISADPTYLGINLSDGAKVLGNASQIKKLQEAGAPGVVTLQWNTSANSGSSDGTKLRVGRAAERAFRDALKELPEGLIVTNSPVGAMSGDYERADLYARRGFGPVQTDGAQYGIIHNGQIEPLSPFIADENHLRHLADRAYEAGDLETNDLVRRALNQRRAENLDQQMKAASESKGYGSYSDDDYQYDYNDYDDYDQPRPITRDDIKQSIEYAIAPESNTFSGNYGNVTVIPEIEARRGYQRNTQYAPEGSYEPTPDDVEEFRALQIGQLNTPSRARDVIDFINSASPRPTPQPVTVESLAASRQSDDRRSRRFDDRSELRSGPDGERLQLSINRLRDRLGEFSEGYDSDPAVLRDQLKRDLITRRTNPDGLGVVAQELYSTQDLENFRTLQMLQSQAFPVSTPSRVPPPTLNPDGTIQSRRPTPEDALIDASSHLDRFNPHGELINGTTVEWRRQLNPEQQAAVDRLPDVLAGPATARRNINHLDQWLQSGTTSSQMMRDLYGGNSVEQMLQNANINPNATPNLARDMRLLETGLTQPGRVSTDDVAQSIHNLRQLEAGQQQTLDNLRGVIATSTYGPAAQVRRGPDTTPIRVANDDDGLGIFRRSSGAGRRPRRPNGLEAIQAETERRTPAPKPKRVHVAVDKGDPLVRPTGQRAVKPEAFRLRATPAEDLDAIERLLEGY